MKYFILLGEFIKLFSINILVFLITGYDENVNESNGQNDVENNDNYGNSYFICGKCIIIIFEELQLFDL